MFKKSNQESKASTHACLVVAYEIAKHGKPFSEGEFVKDCMLKVEIACPDKLLAFQNISLSRMTISCRVGEIARDINNQLKNDIGFTAHLLISIWKVSENFQISERLFAMISLKDRTQSSDLCDAVSDAIDKSNLQWSQLVWVTMDGAPSMTDRDPGLVSLLRKKSR